MITHRRKRSVSRKAVVLYLSMCGLFLLLLRTSQLVASRYSDNVWLGYDVGRVGKTVTSSTTSQGRNAHNNLLQRAGEIETHSDLLRADNAHIGESHMESGMPKPNNIKGGHHPRVMEISDSRQYQNLRRERSIEVSKYALQKQKSLGNSDSYDDFRDPLYYKDCVPMQAWQETSFPSCNIFHESDFYGKSRGNEFSHLTSGGYNDVLIVKSIFDNSDVVFKMLQYGTDVSDRNFDRVRRDGLILERSSKSPYVLDIYGYCGFGILTPFATSGTLSKLIRNWRRDKVSLSSKDRLLIALKAARGLDAVHDIDGDGMSAVSHGDLKPQQYLLFEDDTMRLSDFNRGRFIRRNSTSPDTSCPYTIGQNDAAFRAPEEYLYLPETAKIDVWALGSILYFILTGRDVWSDTPTREAQKLIIEGEMPEFPKPSGDPVDAILRKAIDLCYVYDPEERPNAKDIVTFLEKEFSKLYREDKYRQ